MPPASQSKEVNTENIQEKNIDLADHNELAVFELQEIHDALDHVLDYLVRQNDETIQEIHRQTDIDERIISEVRSYDGRIETIDNTVIQEIFTESARENIPTYEIVRESISEIISEDDTMTPGGGTTYEHHKFTEKFTLNTSASVDEKENDTLSHATNTERKKMLIVIVLLSIAIIILGIVIIRH